MKRGGRWKGTHHVKTKREVALVEVGGTLNMDAHHVFHGLEAADIKVKTPFFGLLGGFLAFLVDLNTKNSLGPLEGLAPFVWVIGWGSTRIQLQLSQIIRNVKVSEPWNQRVKVTLDKRLVGHVGQEAWVLGTRRQRRTKAWVCGRR